METLRKPSRFRRVLTLAASALLVASAGLARGDSSVAQSSGTFEKGKLELQLYRGAAAPLELTVIETPNNCEGHVDLTLEWNEETNLVKGKLKGKGVLTPHPTVRRTQGVDWLPNPFFPEPKDVVNGRYQLWIVSPARELTFFYDPATLNLLGSELDFETPPAGAIVTRFPAFRLFGTDFFQPKPNGDVDFEFSFRYDRITRGDRPDLTDMHLTFPPPNLCGANPFRLDLSHLRPYVSKPAPAADGPSFAEYLRGGILFDITVEPPVPFVEPPTHTNIGSYSQATVTGTVPRNYILDIDAALANVGPPIIPWAGAASCQQWTPPFHDRGINFCEGG